MPRRLPCLAPRKGRHPALLLIVENLIKAYRSPDGQRVPIVQIERFEMAAGEQLALRGESGCGKTTFLNLISGITSADGGRIQFDGCEVTALSTAGRDKLRAVTLGSIFQSFNLLQGYTALENVELAMRLGCGVDHAFARDLLDRVGLSRHRDHLPSQLSIGQQQRVAIARALSNRPRLILADEPTGNLDHRNAREAIALIRALCAETHSALLVVSHDRELLSTFEKVIAFESLNQAGRAAGASAAGSGDARAE